MNVTNLAVKQSGKHGTAPLQNIKILDSLIRVARDRAEHLPGIVSFTGPSGFGKSTAAGYAAAEHSAIYVEIRSMWTKKALLEAILRTMGLPPGRNSYQMLDTISEELTLSQRPLIIDEFDHAIERGLIEMVRDIYEQSKSPIVLIGEERLPQKLKRFERFHGRIMEWAQAQPINVEDAMSLNRHYAPQVMIHEDLLALLVAEAKGSARRMVTNIDRIAKFSIDEGLSTISAKQWGGRPIHTGQAPKERAF